MVTRTRRAVDGSRQEGRPRPRFSEATVELRSAFRIDKDYGPTRERMGAAYLRKGWLTDARHELERAAELNPDAVEARLALGRVVLDLGDAEATQKELDRLKGTTLANIKQEKVQPMTMALRVLPELLYGGGHAYATPLTGSGTEESVGAMTRADLVKFHQTWFKPNNATLVVVGDTTLAEIQRKLEDAGRCRQWHPRRNVKCGHLSGLRS